MNGLMPEAADILAGLSGVRQKLATEFSPLTMVVIRKREKFHDFGTTSSIGGWENI